MNGITIWVYKDQSLGDCSNNGATNRYETILLFHEGISVAEVEAFIKKTDISEDKCFRVETIRRGQPNEYKRAIPVFRNGKHWMSGGCFGYTCDSRYNEVTGGLRYPISIHDRTEDMEEYLSHD